MVRKHKPCTGLKVYSMIVSLLLIVAIILTGCAFGLGWVQIAETVDDVEQDGADEEVGGMVVETAEEYGISLLSTKATLASSDTSYTITATAYDANELALDQYQYFTFSMAWATTKSDSVENYVSMTTTDNTATFTCLQAFDTQIIVTVTNTVDTSLSATATIDYYQRVTGITVNGTSVTDSTGSTVVDKTYYGVSSGQSVWQTDSYFDYSGTTTYGTGSLANSVSATVTVSISDAFKTALQNSGSPIFLTIDIPSSYTLPNVVGGTQSYWFSYLFGETLTTTQIWSAASYIQNAIASTSNQVTVSVTLTPTYGSEVTYTYTLNMEMESTTLSNLDLSEDSFIF